MKNLKVIACIILFFLIAALAVIYSNTPIFMDEEEIITGGWLITKGYVIYKDFFVHHMPFSYYLFSLPVFLFKHPSIYLIRYITNFSLIFILLFLGIYSKKGLKQFWIFYYILILLFCFHLFAGYWTILADTTFAVAALAIFITVLDKPDCDFSLGQKLIISFSIFAGITSTLIAVYPFLFFMIYYYVVRLINNKIRINKKFIKEELKFIAILAAPFVIWLIYMLITGSLGDFWDKAYLFNIKYYAKYNIHSNGGESALALIVNHFKCISELFNFNNNYFLLFMKLCFWAYVVKLIIKKEYNLAVFIPMFAFLLKMRSDFHDAPYYYILIYIFVLFIRDFCNRFVKLKWSALILIPVFAFFLITIHYDNLFFYTSMFLSDKPENMVIKNLLLNNAVKAIVKNDEKFVSLPFDSIEYYNIEREPANYNLVYLPWHNDLPGNQEGIIKDIEKYKVKVIKYDLLRAIFIGEDKEHTYIDRYATSLTQYINENYYTYRFSRPYYFRKEFKTEIDNILKSRGFPIN